MNPQQLLHDCEQLSHAGRMKTMVELGRQAASDMSVKQTLALLAEGDVYQRCLAVQSCYGSHDREMILQKLSDPSRSVRSLALNLTALLCSDDEIQTVLAQLSASIRTILIRHLHQRRRYTVINAYLETLMPDKTEELSYLLPFGSREIVTRYLGQVHERLSEVTLNRLANNYPDLLVAMLLTRVAEQKNANPYLVRQANMVLPTISEASPDLALELVKKLVTLYPLTRLDLSGLLKKRPNEIVDLILQTNEQKVARFDAVALNRLDTEHLLALFTNHPDLTSNNSFKTLRAEQRLALYTLCERRWRTDEGQLAYNIVARLPTEQREKEGRRNLELPALLARPAERLPYAAFLPWNEASSILDAPLHSPDADLRGLAIRTLINAVRYQRSHLKDVLKMVRDRRHEQDPVRKEIFTALADLPHSIWKSEHLDDLSQIIYDALNASDLSWITSRAMEKLVVFLFQFHAEWSANHMTIIYSKRGTISILPLETYLSDADIKRISPLLTPILDLWQKREKEGLLVALAKGLRRRVRTFNTLLDLLNKVLNDTLNHGHANTIIELFMEYQPERVDNIIVRLLDADKSTITLPAVYQYLHRQRQDLLTPFLGQHAYHGRFGTGKTRFVPLISNGFYRWTPEQQNIFAHTLLEIVDKDNQHRGTRELIRAIQCLAAMPALQPDLLLQFAHDTRQPVRDTTLRVLGRLDAGQGIPTLLEALKDERARIAIYALRQALLAMPEPEALQLLHNAPLIPVTVGKEVVRLIGELSSEAAYQELLALDKSDLHRDIRIALLRALWSHTARQESWEHFVRAAQDPLAAIARGVIHIPTDGLPASAQQQLANLTVLLLNHPELEVRMATLKWRSKHPISDPEQVLFTPLLSLLKSSNPDECQEAAETVFSIYAEKEAKVVAEVIREIMQNRRVLKITIDAFKSALRIRRRFLGAATRAILTVLTDDPLTLSLRIGLIIQGLPWPEILPALIQLLPVLHMNALEKAKEAIQQAYTRPDAHLFELESELAQSKDERLRLLALAALIAQSRQTKGWSDECIARLQRYREDPSPMIAEEATFTFVS